MSWLVVVPVVLAKFLLPITLVRFPFLAGWATSSWTPSMATC